jgi:hypothetical protein
MDIDITFLLHAETFTVNNAPGSFTVDYLIVAGERWWRRTKLGSWRWCGGAVSSGVRSFVSWFIPYIQWVLGGAGSTMSPPYIGGKWKLSTTALGLTAYGGGGGEGNNERCRHWGLMEDLVAVYC